MFSRIRRALETLASRHDNRTVSVALCQVVFESKESKMPAEPLTDFSRLCIHTITTTPWSIEEAIEKYAAAGVKGITVWRQWLEGRDPVVCGKMARDAGLEMVSVARGGFFPASDEAGRQAAIDDNRRAIDECQGLDAPVLILVCGAVPGMPLSEGRKQIRDGIAAVADHAEEAGVKLGIEALHPMYADCRSAVNTLGQANDHVRRTGALTTSAWWSTSITSGGTPTSSGRSNGAAIVATCSRLHVCDWRTPTEDMLNDRGLMGEGCINIREIRGWVEETGFKGYNEVEIFSNRLWATDQDQFLADIKKAYLEHV